MAGRLSVVATPIGNLEDMTFRAVRTLKEAHVIAAEDTRRTRKLMAHYGISAELTSYHGHNEKEKAPRLIEALKDGRDVALVSDAGTPGISDPGLRLISAAVENGIDVAPIPGASSLTAVLSVCGLPTDTFRFMGFVPKSDKERRCFFSSLGHVEDTFVMFESPKRLGKTLLAIRDELASASVVVARELTKLHEEILRGNAGDIIEAMGDREARGEITIVLRTARQDEVFDTARIRGEIERLLSGGVSLRDAVSEVSLVSGASKKTVYGVALEVKGGAKGGGA